LFVHVAEPDNCQASSGSKGVAFLPEGKVWGGFKMGAFAKGTIAKKKGFGGPSLPNP